MSEKDKDEASRLAWEKLKEYPPYSSGNLMELPFINGFRDGYAAGRESLRAEIDEQCRLNGMGQERELKLMTQLKAERARSEKLYKAANDMAYAQGSQIDGARLRMWRSIAEYGTSRE